MLAELADAARELTGTAGASGFRGGRPDRGAPPPVDRGAVQRVELTPQSGVVEALRAVEDADEIAVVRRAAALLEGVGPPLGEEGL